MSEKQLIISAFVAGMQYLISSPNASGQLNDFPLVSLTKNYGLYSKEEP